MVTLIRQLAQELGIKTHYHVFCEYYDGDGNLYSKATHTAFATPWLHKDNLKELKQNLSAADKKPSKDLLVVSITRLGI